MNLIQKHNLTAATAAALSIAALATSVLLSSCDENSVPAGTVPDGTETGTMAVTEAVFSMTGPQLASYLAESCTFSEALTQNDVYLANHAFGFGALTDKLDSYTAYVPSGIIPEEVFVFDVKAAEDVQSIVDKLNAYVSYQAGEYAEYAAGEVPKLDDPVIAVKDDLVVYVISADNAAAADTVKNILG